VLLKNIKLESCDVIIKNNETAQDYIKIFPNPAANTLHFDFPRELSFPLQLDFYSKDGKPLQKFSIPTLTDQFTLKLDHFLAGMYFIKISEKNRISFRKFIKI
jgi:hypothetical protein